MATPPLHRQWVLLGGWKTPVPMGCSTHIPSCTGICTVASLSDSSFWLSRAVAAGFSWGASCAHKASMALAATRPPHWGCPRSLTCLVCFAVLGWSRHSPLGHLSPPTPSLLLLDQVGPWATVPCLPATLMPQEWASQRHSHQCCGVGCRAFPDPAQLPHTVTQSQYWATSLGANLPSQLCREALGPPSPFSWHLALPSPSHGQTLQARWSHLSSGIFIPPSLGQEMRRNPSPLPIST